MNDPTDKELLDILGVKVENKKKNIYSSTDEYIISGFEEIQQFFLTNNRIPENNDERDIFERIYAIRLSQILNDDELISLLTLFDPHGILKSFAENNKSRENKENNDSELLSELGIDTELTKLKHVRSSEERKLISEFANREKCKDFDIYKPLFDEINNDLKKSNKTAIPLKERTEIKRNQFFILNGLITYVADIGQSFIQNYGIIDARLYLIFSNGTESRMLMRSLQKALFDDKGARIITENNLGPLFTSSITDADSFSGMVYILRSNSELPYILENRNLIHKIGFTTTTVKKRISNAKSDPTFLMAEVEIVASYKLFNIKSSKFENLVQKIFAKSKLDINIKDRFGKLVKPDEWFLVPLNVIKIAIDKIIDGSIIEYNYEPSKGELIKINELI